MSLNVFENTNLDFEVSLIKLDRRLNKDAIEDVVDSVIPIDAAAILNLDITESSLSMGAKGSITISNKFNILERLDIATNSPNDLYVAIKIIDTELNKTDIDDTNKVVTVIGLVNTTAAGSLNIVDNILIFKWEEAFVAATRKTQIGYLTGKGEQVGIKFEGKPSDIIQIVEKFNKEIFKLKTDDSITVNSSYLPNVLHDIKTTEDMSHTVYDALHTMLKETTASDSGAGTIGKVPYFRFVNAIVDGEVKRKLKFDAFLTDRHIEFINAVKNGIVGVDYSDVYLEKFSIGPLTDESGVDPNINLYNKIETYNITRADIGKLREEIWGDYHVLRSSGGMDFSVFSNDTVAFADIESDFINRELAGADVSVNLPLLDPKEIQEFHVDINTQSDPVRTAQADLQWQNSIANTVLKSFLTINETIRFTVKGSVIRQPNKFIWIERNSEEDYKKLWYVNSVTHSFKEGKYTTDIIATKIFGDTTLEAIEASKLPVQK